MSPCRFVPRNPQLSITSFNHKGHFTYECQSTRPYVSRPSRTAQLEHPRLLAKSKPGGQPSVEVPEEFKNKFVWLLSHLREPLLSCH
ncbi:hypothetical protein B0F90DRAFT_1705524 [Multifurca ochricompacta]|uniref:Uncharacterized protein n=1 Tax=Multifurca ochricompacta TaxID=376703 RepID=A0AAD4QNV9_9AGAM|nr:hypothetical protein B0F90DRAFT_1705524 [Multifurca ochricompacta]